MKGLRTVQKPFITILAALVVVVAGVGVAHAAGMASAVVTGTSNKTLYKVGQTVNITGTVNGDIFCTAQTVTIDATVNGDVLCAGQTVTVNGVVHGDVRIVGQSINIGASVDHNVSLIGQSVTVQDNAVIGEDAGIVGQTVILNGTVGRDLSATTNSMTLNNSIGRNVSARVGAKLTLDSNANVAGNISYNSPQTWQKNNGATVTGTVTYHKIEPSHKRNFTSWIVIGWLYWIIAMVVLAVVLVALFPQLFRRWNQAAVEHLGLVLLTGFIAMFAVPIAAFVLFSTLIGAPLGVFVLLLWLVASVISLPLAMYSLGQRIVPKMHPLLMVLIGSVILGVVGIIPVLGWIVIVLAYFIGIGTLLWNLKRLYPKPDYSVQK